MNCRALSKSDETLFDDVNDVFPWRGEEQMNGCVEQDLKHKDSVLYI